MADEAVILAVNDKPANVNVLRDVLGRSGYQVIGASSAGEVETALKEHSVGVGLIDISGFGRDVWAICDRLRDEEVPFLVISARQSAAVEHESESRGSAATMSKPLGIDDLFAFVRSLMER